MKLPQFTLLELHGNNDYEVAFCDGTFALKNSSILEGMHMLKVRMAIGCSG